ncbi:uncharacterized protein LOC113234176 isoform X2 [Hyposmocoma kahamanoa]|uniref:uncharacterized protein LOC113234176 isoform X2 n=1 Tax=Hyposmocoma kahamanoa TaxID=1477025 RepID=UPI000E6D9C09|nr:uncharacterized protein LOC113234176 isoform X2 [Hyposmocoma kahamanoa]
MRCFLCDVVLCNEIQRYKLSDIGLELSAVFADILNREIDCDGYLCEDCLTSAVNRLSLELRTQVASHCIWCKKSILGHHSHRLPNGPERDHIALRILPRQIQPEHRVCYACWLAARRNVQRAQMQDQNRAEPPGQLVDQSSTSQPQLSISQPQPSTSQPQPSTSQPQPSTSHASICVWCQRSIARCHSHSLREGPERDVIMARRISPRLIELHSRVCYACWLSVRRNVAEEVTPESANTNFSQQQTSLPNYRRTGNSANTCFVHGCMNPERFTVPNFFETPFIKIASFLCHRRCTYMS